jgi:transposase
VIVPSNLPSNLASDLPSNVDARRLSPEVQADLRRRVVAAVETGMSQQEAARVFGISRRAVGVWVRAHRSYGPEALKPHRRGRHPGDQFALSRLDQAQLLQDVAAGPPDVYGIDAPLWSRRVLAQYILKRFGLNLTLTTIGHYLVRWGLVAGEGYPWRGPVGTLWVMWHRPTPRFVGSALVPGPGSLLAGPVPGTIGPRPDYLDVVFAQSSRGTTHFLCLPHPHGVADLLEFGERLERTFGGAVTPTVREWPPDERALLRSWQAAGGRRVRSPFA